MAKIIVYTYNFAWMDGVNDSLVKLPHPYFKRGNIHQKKFREGTSTSYKIEWVQRGLSDGSWFIKTDKGTSTWKYETKE